jgi:hypothetical protein
VGESPQVDIVLHGIRGMEAYAQANRVLKNLSPVQSAGATGTKDSKVTIRVAFSGEIEQLKQYIALDPRLVPLSDAEVSKLPSDQKDDSSEQDEASSEQGDQTENTGPSSFLMAPAGNNSSRQMFVYDALLAGQDESEKAFESLYQVLHYRWQPASIIEGESGE